MKRKPSFAIAISTLLFMFMSIIIGNGIFDIGVKQLLILSAVYAAIIGKTLGYTYVEMEEGISEKLKQ
ncbi:hypothetical protein QUF55_07295, partial [Clostridiaceae bacterium HSG29]|nr:hypothetical protein [Clostridiaceae bacterium HSG29]